MASRRNFYLILLASIGLLAYLFGFSSNSGGESVPSASFHRPAPLFSDSKDHHAFVKGPQRGMQ